ncbi:MAG: DUF4331 domain-containing protein [Sporichthyaceae bacterium]
MRKVRLRSKLTAVTAVGVAGTLAVGGLGLLGGQAVNASSHREAPAITDDPKADNTDTYAFVSPDKKNTVTLLANWYPFQEPNGGPNFYPFATDARYNIHVDNDGDAKPDITYRWKFKNVDKRGTDTFLYNNGPVGSLGDANLLFKQRYTLTKIENGKSTVIVRNGTAAPSFTGKASMPNYGKLRAQATRKLDKGSGRTYAGAADDSFALDLRVFDLLYGTKLKSVGQDTLKGYNVNTLAIQVPKNALALKKNAKNNPVIGVWATTERQSVEIVDDVAPMGGDGGGSTESKDQKSGLTCGTPLEAVGCSSVDKLKEGQVTTARVVKKWVQVSRLGNPLVNEAVAPAGLKDAFLRLKPENDADVAPLVERVTDPEVPKLIEAIYGLKAPATPRNDLVQIFLTGVAKGNGPIEADLNSLALNKDVEGDIRPAEMLRLNMSVPVTKNPNRLGVLAGDLQGFPNGRRMGDDVVDIAIQALMGAATKGIVKALAAGDGVNQNNKKFTRSFPYIAGPNEQAVNTQ